MNYGEQSGSEAGFLPVLLLFPVSIILSSPHIGFLYVLLLTEGQTGEARHPFGCRGALDIRKNILPQSVKG